MDGGHRRVPRFPYGHPAGLKQGQSYTLTEYNREIGTITPLGTTSVIVPPKKVGGAQTFLIPRRELRSASSVDALLEEEKGSW